ncbi:MAG: CvpA family protein [Clostridia bacterium]|nr:CvpA family protein [Clostridia bacterium]
MENKKPHGPKNKVAKFFVNLLVTLVVGGVYFYITLPAINLHDSSFYAFIFLLCLVFVVCALFTSGFNLEPGGGFKEYFRFIKTQCLPVGILLAGLILVCVVGAIISMPIFRAADYRDLLTVQDGDFTTDVQEVSYNEIPMLDERSAQRLGDRQMGNLPSDKVSQFEVADDYTQINYKSRPVRVTPLEYADLIKWLTNRSEGLPAYIIVDMVTQEAQLVELKEGMKYSPSEPLNRNIMRHLRFGYPTFMFSTPTFEIDDNGHPWWIAPRVVKTIGLFGGTDIQGAVMVDAVTGESQYFEEVPNWVDRVYLADLIVEQYNYHGTFVHGFINSVFGQRDVKVTTEGYNYIALNDDVYMYTGITSVSTDQSNVGFILSNQRTKETKYYKVAGAKEYSAMDSAQGVVQHLNYKATFPLLLNIAGEPTYFMSLKDNAELVKMYAMVNVAQYNVVATGTTVAQCEQEYIRLLTQNNITTPEMRPETSVSGKVTDIRTAVLDGNSYYFLQLEGEEVYYALSAVNNPVVVVVNVGDTVTVEHAPQTTPPVSILDGYTVEVNGKAANDPIVHDDGEALSAPVGTPGT